MIDTLYELFIAPWTWGAWMWRGVLSASLMGIAAAIWGVFLYLRRLSLMADALAHVALLGIVVAYLLLGVLDGTAMVLAAAMTGLVTAGLVGNLSRDDAVRPDAAIGIVFTALFALGVVLLSVAVDGVHLDTQHALMGDVLGVSDQSLKSLAAVCVATILAVVVFYRPLVTSTFDPAHAMASGVATALIHYALVGAVSLTAVAGFESVGAVLVVALFVTPAAFAHLFARSIPGMLAFACAHSLVSTVLGMYLAVWFGVSASGSIVTAGFVGYLAAVVARRTRSSRRRRKQERSRSHPATQPH